MTLLLFLKPIFHQGFSPPADDDPDRLPKKKKRKIKKPTRKFVQELSETLAIPEVVDVKSYVEDILRRESEVSRLREVAKVVEEEQQRIKAEEDTQKEVDSLIESIGLMVKRSIAAKRKRLNTLIASILDWL